MHDADHADAGDRPGERDTTSGRREHRLPYDGGEVDTAMPGQPRFGRRIERTHYRRPAGQRPLVQR